MSYKVVIINPKTRHLLDTNEPLNILAIATFLKKSGIDVKIIDELAGDDAVEKIKEFKPDLVGFTAVTCTYPRALELLKMVKPLGYLTVIGGVHASTLPEKAIEDGFDMVVVGEGERMFLEIITKKEKKGIFRTPKEIILKSEELILPDRTLINMDFYRKAKDRSPHDFNLDFVPLGADMACMLTSRGCPFDCIFCHNGWRATPLRFFSPEVMIEEVENIIRNYKAQYIWFLDDDFFQNKIRAKKFCELVLEKNIRISWATSSRPDSVDDEILAVASRAGCRRIAFGFESGSQRILDILNKRSNVQRNFFAAELCRKHNIEVAGLFMVGNPTETKEDILLTWKFIKKAKLDSISISVTTPFPGTRLWKWCEEKGYISDDIDYSDFYYTHAPIQIPETFTPKQVEAIKRNLIIKIYLFHPKSRKRFILKIIHHPLLMFEKIMDYFPFFKKRSSLTKTQLKCTHS